MREEQEKEQEKAKRKQNILNGIAVASSVVVLAYFAKQLSKEHLEDKAKKAAENIMKSAQNKSNNSFNYLSPYNIFLLNFTTI